MLKLFDLLPSLLLDNEKLQEIEEILPDVVETQTTGIKTVNPDNLTWYLVNAVKELSARVQELESRQ